jgi:ABC-type multidrug transport system fused ATPase/permease subunit
VGRRRPPVLLRLVRLAFPYRGQIMVALFILTAASILTLATPYLIAYAIDTGLGIVEESGETVTEATGDMRTLLFAVALIITSATLRGAFAFGQTYIAERISQSVAYDLRNSIYDHLQRLSYAYHDTAETGQIMSRATQDVEGVRFFITFAVLRFISVVLLIVFAYALMVATNVRVGLTALAFLPFVAISSLFISTKLRPIWREVQDLQGDMANVLQENLTGQRVVKAFSRAEHEQEKFDAKVNRLFQRSFDAVRYESINEPLMITIWLLSSAVVFWVGVIEIEAGNLRPGELVGFQLYLTILQVPLRMLSFMVSLFALGHSAGTRIYEILDAESAVEEKPDAIVLPPGPGRVRFDHVSFGYEALSPVLKDLDLEVEPGQTVALLGPTGSGKSTVVNLLPRFYDVTEGAITIDGHDVRDLTLESLRASIGTVQQDAFLFHATIRENIAYGKPDATDEEIEAAARAAMIHDYIASEPDGYDMEVGERGVTLSGGQRQRVAIARTILLNPRILVFDDSTAAVDMRTEFLIQQALRNLMAGRTTFVIAQRLRTVQEADQILVMQGGTIVERGTHEELLESGGFYRDIYDLELRDQEESAAALPDASPGPAPED